MLNIIFYILLLFGFILVMSPIINILLSFIRDTLILSKNFAKIGINKAVKWDKKRIKRRMDAYHRGEGNYEYYDPDKPVWNIEVMNADYDQDKYDDPFYIPDDDK